MDPDEKSDLQAVEHVGGDGPYASLSAEDADFTRSHEGKRDKSVVRKIDLRLVPAVCLLYLCSHIDRDNIGNAKIEGMDKDLGLRGGPVQHRQHHFLRALHPLRYEAPPLVLDAATTAALTMLSTEVPSNIVIKKVRRSIWLSCLVVSWGIVMTLMGVVKNFQGMVACRAMLGLCEVSWHPARCVVPARSGSQKGVEPS